MTSPTCPACGYVYGEGERLPCPSCGSHLAAVELTARVEVLASLRAVWRRAGFALVSHLERMKRSAHGKLARERLRFDRTDPEATVKAHHVEERRDDGTWDVVHDEREEHPARRRPTD